MAHANKPIPGWIYIIIGIAIIAYSKFIESRTKSNLIAFVVIGGLFIVWGIIREFVPRLKARSAKKVLVGPPAHTPEHQSTHTHPAGTQAQGISPHQSAHVQPSQQYSSHPYSAQHKRCIRCHTINAGGAKFCHNCAFQFY